ncbi:MAG: HTH-type transcriptional regulator NimR [Luteibacter sp.]|uniref:AraC family transcriptional regulator n=1 Tax=Luteibacter sp. TaxID=1886636 RepID=UPI00138494FB|nr:AraC family transcriptional regulator [Luteibacter sp.]KAF1004893.1 MAG: HTH-type transcriptional regulator NimR [Luteibacter sp.]
MPPRRSASAPSSANRVAHAAGVAIGPHTHDDGQLTLAVEGSVRIQDETGWHLATPGTAVWVPPRRRHAASYPKSCELIRMHLPAAMSDGLPDRCALLPMSTLAVELVRRASRLTAQDSRELTLLNELLLIQLADRPSLADFSVPDAKDKRVRMVTRHLRDHPASNETLAELGTRVGTSERTLARKFQEETGLNFRQWRDRLRIVAAIERMIQGEPLTAVAIDVGYSGASSFTTAFTRLVGNSPGEYLRGLRRL